MKKIITIALIAAFVASCTYKSDMTSQRTPANLANLNIELINNSTTAAVLTLLDIDMQAKDTILTAGFDTLLTAEAYYDRFGSSAGEMDIQLVADSTWTFTSTGTGGLAFAGTIRMTGRNKENYATFKSAYTGTYDEGNGFTADFSSTKLEFSLLTTMTYVDGYGYTPQLMLLCYGDAILKTYRNSSLLDSVTTTFNGDGVSY